MHTAAARLAHRCCSTSSHNLSHTLKAFRRRFHSGITHSGCDARWTPTTLAASVPFRPRPTPRLQTACSSASTSRQLRASSLTEGDAAQALSHARPFTAGQPQRRHARPLQLASPTSPKLEAALRSLFLAGSTSSIVDPRSLLRQSAGLARFRLGRRPGVRVDPLNLRSGLSTAERCSSTRALGGPAQQTQSCW